MSLWVKFSCIVVVLILNLSNTSFAESECSAEKLAFKEASKAAKTAIKFHDKAIKFSAKTVSRRGKEIAGQEKRIFRTREKRDRADSNWQRCKDIVNNLLGGGFLGGQNRNCQKQKAKKDALNETLEDLVAFLNNTLIPRLDEMVAEAQVKEAQALQAKQQSELLLSEKQANL